MIDAGYRRSIPLASCIPVVQEEGLIISWQLAIGNGQLQYKVGVEESRLISA